MSLLAHRALLCVLCAVTVIAGGCGAGTSAPVDQESLKLEREDLVVVARALTAAAPSVHSELQSAKAAWPLVANGLPRHMSTPARESVRSAAANAAKLRTPPLFAEHTAGAITGPGSKLAGAFRGFVLLSTRGWRLIDGALDEVEYGSATTARFARANVALYIESVYDAHFSLAQIGRQLLAAYEKLGGPGAFGSSLTQAEANALAQTYSEASDRLHPHDGVKLGT